MKCFSFSFLFFQKKKYNFFSIQCLCSTIFPFIFSFCTSSITFLSLKNVLNWELHLLILEVTSVSMDGPNFCHMTPRHGLKTDFLSRKNTWIAKNRFKTDFSSRTSNVCGKPTFRDRGDRFELVAKSHLSKIQCAYHWTRKKKYI